MTSFGHFADCENYYALRLAQDAALYEGFLVRGGEPEERHPLSFVLGGSDYLRRWFSDGIETRLPLSCVSPTHIRFTEGDSGSGFAQSGALRVLTLADLLERLETFGSLEAYRRSTGRNYIDAQLWSVRCLPLCQIENR